VRARLQRWEGCNQYGGHPTGLKGEPQLPRFVGCAMPHITH
jgi:hypothetical protein